jgi:hypothetical protein
MKYISSAGIDRNYLLVSLLELFLGSLGYVAKEFQGEDTHRVVEHSISSA